MRADLFALSIGMASFGTVTIIPNIMAFSPMALTGSGVWISSGILGMIASIADGESAADILKIGGLSGFVLPKVSNIPEGNVVLHLFPAVHCEMNKTCRVYR